MCAIDALGIAAMLARSVVISSAEPGTGSPITVTVPAAAGRAVWEPAGTVVFEGEQATCRSGTGPDAAVPPVAADECCNFIRFFTSRTSAEAWAAAHPQIAGRTLSQQDALATGTQIFGPLLRSGTQPPTI